MQSAPEVQEAFQNVDGLPIVEVNLISATFCVAKNHLKNTVTYPGINAKMNPDGWNVSTWCKNVQRSVIMKKGTEEDKARLPPPTPLNSSRKQTKKRNKPLSDRCKTKRRAPPQEQQLPQQDDPEAAV